MTTSSELTLSEVLWKGSAAPWARGVRALVLAVAGAGVLAVAAKVQLPFWPVPVTLQTLAVLVLGMAYGPRLVAATVALYLAEGALGLPVFAGPLAGIGYLAGPTGGYLLGFVPAAAVTGWLATRGWDLRASTALVALAAGLALIYLPGVAWLSKFVGVEQALTVGFAVFLPAEAAKLVLAACLAPVLWKVVTRWRLG